MIPRLHCWSVCAHWHPWFCISGAGWRFLLPPPNFHLKECSDTHEPYVPNPHNKISDLIMVMSLTIISIVTFTPYYSDFYSNFLYSPMFEGCWMQFTVVDSELHPTAARSVLSDLWCHLSLLIELISFTFPLQICPPVQTQPYRLLSWVESTLPSGHCTDSAWNHAIAWKA